MQSTAMSSYRNATQCARDRSKVGLMAFADVHGQKIYFEDSGGDGPAIIFSHGLYMQTAYT